MIDWSKLKLHILLKTSLQYLKSNNAACNKFWTCVSSQSNCLKLEKKKNKLFLKLEDEHVNMSVAAFHYTMKDIRV